MPIWGNGSLDVVGDDWCAIQSATPETTIIE